MITMGGDPKSLPALHWAHKCAVTVQSGWPHTHSRGGVPGSVLPEQACLKHFNINKIRIKRRNEICREFLAQI